ncbi:hypothetical protein SLA2020_392070 [Shorea laevis]
MSFEANHFQEFRVAEMAGKRKKVDGFPLIIPPREDGDHIEPESKFDLRKSLAWDTAFFTSPGILDPEELFETLNVGNLENGVNKPERGEQRCLPSGSLDPERISRVAECNARRSLAWDSAFFTSAGFLDLEELSMVNRGFQKSEAPMLPGIEEDFWKSADSNSTIDSEFSLASLEIDLFDHMKTSLQKSSTVSDVSVSSSEMGEQNFQSSKMVDSSSRTMTRPVLSSRKQSVKVHGKEKIAKVRLQASARNGEYNSSSSCKPSKTLNQAEPLSSFAIKKASLSAKTEKGEHKIKKDAFGKNMSKKPCCGDSGSGISLTPSPRSASSGGSDSALSKSINKSLSNSLRRKNHSRLAAYDSSSTTPSRGDSLDSNATQVPHNGSPSCDRNPSGSKVKEMKLTNQHVDRLSKGTGPLTQTVSGSLKPSSLRMPLPKTGFFDMEKSMALEQDSNLKFHTGLQTTKIRSSGSNLDRTSNRGKCSKLQSARTSMRTKRMKLGSPEAGASSFGPGIKPASPTDFEVRSARQKSDPKEEEKEISGIMENKSGMESKGEAHQMVQKQDHKQNEDVSTNPLKDDPRAVCGNDKENISNFRNEVDDLTRLIEAIEFGRDSAIEL